MELIATQPPPLTPRATPPRNVEVAGHQLAVFVESQPLFDAMLADIAAAKTRIWCEVYIFFNDDGGTRIAEALKAKAREGLDVRLMYDAVGAVSTPAKFFADIAQAGVKVHAYHTFWEGLRKFRPLTILNRRNHRKLLVIDETAGYFGGMNFIDNVESVEKQKQENRPASSGWRDVHLRLAGPQIVELADSFLRSWKRAHGEEIPKRSKSYRRCEMAPGDESIRFFDSGPGSRFSRAARVYTTLLSHAKNAVHISMAYFLPVGKVFRALARARKRHVKFRIVVPGKSDVKIVQRATTFLYRWLLRRGFRVYERQHRMLHSKMMVVDSQWTAVGSCNIDPRSLFTNLEFICVIRSKRLAEAMIEICQTEIAASKRVRSDDCGQTWWERTRNRLAWQLRWWL